MGGENLSLWLNRAEKTYWDFLTHQRCISQEKAEGEGGSPMDCVISLLSAMVWRIRRSIRWIVALSVLSLLVLPAVVSARLFVSELMWAGSDLSTSDEWVELSRDQGDPPCDASLSLSGVTLTSVNTSGTEITAVRFGSGMTLSCGEYLIVSRFPADRSRLSVTHRVAPDLTLPNTKLLVRLYDGLKNLLDQADDGIGEPMAGKNASPEDNVRASMERVSFSLHGGLRESWTTASVSLGFDEGVPMLGTPGFPRSSIELSSSSRAQASSSDSADSSSLSNIGATSSSSNALSEGNSSEYVPSSVSSALGSSSSLTSGLSSVQQNYSSHSLAPQSSSSDVGSAPLAPRSSIGSEVGSASPAPQSSVRSDVGSVSSAPLVFISELLPNPLGLDHEGEWIEIANLGAVPVDVAGWTLTLSGSSPSFRIAPLDGTHYILGAGEHRSFRRTQTGLALPNKGSTVLLRRGTEQIDLFSYTEVPEGVSVGRATGDPTSVRPFCVPTESAPNVRRLPEVAIALQSGRLSGEGNVTANFEADLEESIRSSAECFWDFEDGFQSGSCNPPPHTFSEPGTYVVRLRVMDYCINTMVQSVTVNVFEEPKVIKASSSTASSALESSRRSSNKNSSSVSKGSSKSAVAKSRSSSSSSHPSAKHPVLPIFISEVYPLPLSGESEWIELFNPQGTAVHLSGWILDDVRSGGSKPWTFPEGSVIRAGEYLVISSGQSGLKLNDDGDEVWLIAPDNSFTDHLAFGRLKKGQSIARTLPGTNDTFCISAAQSPGTENPCVVQKFYSENVAANRAETKSVSKKISLPSLGIAMRFRTEAPQALTGSTENREVPESYAALKGQLLSTEVVAPSSAPSLFSTVLAIAISISVLAAGAFLVYSMRL